MQHFLERRRLRKTLFFIPYFSAMASDSSSYDLQKGPRVATKSMPYQSLLVELHNLHLQQEIWSSDVWVTPTKRQRHIWILQKEVKLQQMIIILLLNHGVRSQSLDDIQTIAETQVPRIQKLSGAFKAHQNFSNLKIYHCEWKSHILKFMETLQQKIKPHLKEFCLGIVHRLLQGNSIGEYGIFSFVNIILLKLKDFKKLKPNFFNSVKNELQILEQMLKYAHIIYRKMTNIDENLQNFLEFFEPWVNTAAALVILYWADEENEQQFVMISASLQKFNLSILEKVQAYILVIKALRPSNTSEMLVMRNTVQQFIKMILEKFIVSTDHGFDVFREGLTFWTALLVDPPESDAEHEKLICAQTHLLLDQAKSLICSLCMEEDVSERRNIILNDFLEKTNEAKAKVRQLQVHQIPGLSWNNAPKENRRIHFNLLMENLQKKFEDESGLLPFEKHLIAIAHEELSLLRPSLRDTFEPQDEHKDPIDIWVQAINTADLVDYVTDFCLSSTDIPIWSILMHLSNAIEKIRSIKIEVSKIRQNDHICNSRVICTKLNCQPVLPERQEAYNATAKDDFKVGFTKDEQRIIDCLLVGEYGLSFVAVVGMPGQGKTHLAQRIFQNTRIGHHFTKLGWSCISQTYDIKKVFRDILEDVGEPLPMEDFHRLSLEDLAFMLQKCLKGQRYLVVLDDMWDAEAWRELQFSFPDDRNGSRILLTSRIRDVASQVKGNCSIVELHPLSHEESWKLLQMKVFHGDGCPPTLTEIGKLIAENCKGLPLAVVVVGGLLKRDKNVESWKQISESLKPLIASEGCMDIVELSYRHLQDYLKPCFLYFGAFREDEIIDAKKLIQFWIAEGFVQINGKKTMEDVAKEYLKELVSRSLVFVAKRNSRNGIKKCCVHDLFHQLCLIKVEEERFLLVRNKMSDHSSTHYNDQYRIIVHGELRLFLDSKPIGSGLRSLLVPYEGVIYRYGTLGFFIKLKLIRVLDLTSVSVTKVCFHYITQLIHLRLLAVVCRFAIPPSIVNLLRLEVLNLLPTYGDFSVVLPIAVLRMASLRHIFTSICTIEYIECFHVLVPEVFSALINLETLTTVYFHDELSFKRAAQWLKNILKLGFECYHCFRLSGYFKRLESLKLRVICDATLEKEVISPSKLDFPLTLNKLCLNITRQLSSAMISLIGKLPNLEVLKLSSKLENVSWDVEDDEFLHLKYLDFRSSSIQEWNVSDQSFPCLEQLLIRYCINLAELPARFGSVITLRRIEVNGCSDSLSSSFQQIVDDQIDAGNEGLQYSMDFSKIPPEWVC